MKSVFYLLAAGWISAFLLKQISRPFGAALCYHIELSIEFLVAGAGFEPAAFRL